jgi:AcrR family transcriptional regulator
MANENPKPYEVLLKASEIFGSRGYRATSMRDLAEQVNLSKSALYHYFKSKEDLLISIYKEVIDENVASAQRITSVEQPPVAALRALLVDRVVYTCRNRRILRVFHEEEAELPKRLMRQVADARRTYQDLIADLLERGREEGDFEFATTPSIAATVLLGACNWSYKWYNPDGPKTAELLADEVVGLLLAGVLGARARVVV